MQLKPVRTRRVRVQITEYAGATVIKGSVHSISVWETTSDEVASIIQNALDAAAGGSGIPRGRDVRQTDR